MKPMPEGVRARLQKIARLAESGVAGERDNAARLLAALCREHQVDPASLLSPDEKTYRFGINSVREWELFKQCYFYLLQRKEIRYTDVFKAVLLRLTEADAIDLRACFKHYRAAYKAAEDEFFTAFVHKHSLVGPSRDKDDSPPMDPEKLSRLLAMMKSLRADKWNRPVAALEA